jgi:hypothetical protein
VPQQVLQITARYEKAGFAKPVDASATIGADLALARRKQNWLPLSSNSTVQFVSFNLACDGLISNGLLLMGLGWGALKK